MPAANPERDRLAARLRELRAATGLSGNRFAAERIGWAQSRLSRLETGTQLPTEDDIRAWVQAAGADDEATAELLTLLRLARMEYVGHRDSSRQSGGGARDQDSVSRREAEAAHLRYYQPGMVPGLLQTAEYMRELLSLPCGPTAFGASAAGIEAMVAARIRRQEILYQPDKHLHFILGEAALRNPPGSMQTLIGQLDRLASMAGLASIELGITLLGAPMPVFPLSGFVLSNDSVVIETLTGEQRISAPDEVAIYVQAFDELHEASVTGPEAIALIRQVMNELAAQQP